MIIKKKTMVLTALVCLLVFVGFLNNKVNKMALLDSSNEYQKHEAGELAKLNSDGSKEGAVETNSKEVDNIENENIEIVDSKDTEITDLRNDVNNDIEDSITTSKTMSNADYFVEYRLSRDKLREGLIERLNDIINNDKTSKDVLDEAQKEILKIGKLAETELYLEGLIKSKGFEDALVFLKEDSARIIVSVNQLSQQDVMKILEIVKNETSIPAQNIKIAKKF